MHTVNWNGKQRTVVGEKCDDQTRHLLHLEWRDASGHLRRKWVLASACVADAVAEAVSVGRRGQWSRRQDVTEAAAAAVAKADGGVRAGWERWTDPHAPTVLNDHRHIASGASAWQSEYTGNYYATEPYDGITAACIGGPFDTLSAAMDAAEAWWEANKPKVTARDLTGTPTRLVPPTGLRPHIVPPKPADSNRVPCPHSLGIAGLDGCSAAPVFDCPAGAECHDGTHCTIPAPAPADPDALPEGWMVAELSDVNRGCRAITRLDHASGCMVLQFDGLKKTWSGYDGNGRILSSRLDLSRAAAIAACEAWIAANQTTDALPGHWRVEGREVYRSSNGTVYQRGDGQWGASVDDGDLSPVLYATRAEATAWVDAQPTAPACKDCAEKDAEIVRLHGAVDNYAANLGNMRERADRMTTQWQEAHDEAEKRTTELIDAEAEIARLTAELSDARTRLDCAAESLRLTCDELVRYKRERDEARERLVALERSDGVHREEVRRTHDRVRDETTRANRWRNAFYMVGAAWLFAIGIVISMVAQAAGRL